MIAPRKKIAIFVPSMRGGGAQRAMLSLAAGVAERGDVEVDLVLAVKEGPYLQEIPETVNLVDLGATRVVKAIPALVRYLRRERPEGMVSTQDYGNIAAILSRRLSGAKTKLILSEQTTLSRVDYDTAGWRRRLMMSLIRRYYPRADVITAVSDGVADDIAQFINMPRERIQTIYNPIIRRELKDLTQNSLSDPWFHPGAPPVILAVGRLNEAKDYPTLLRAFEKVHRSCDARLLILGEGEERDALEDLIDELGLSDSVRMPGFVDNPYAYMSRASLFVLSSVREGLPTVLVEAMYCGLPVVSTDCPSGPREILKDGQYGPLTPMRDVSALADAMIRTLGSESPSPESCRPYETETVVNSYLQILLNS